MANSGSGNKFLPVNYNRSYGHSNGNGNNNQQYGAARNRMGGSNSTAFVSRPRSSQKSSIPKLSVPPPLNLPSLRKEHQRFDSSGSHSTVSGGLGGGIGSRPGSSGMGWSKSAVLIAASKQENESNFEGDIVHEPSTSKTAYVPPSARMNVASVSGSLQGSNSGNISVLKREDFPSLKASLPVSNANLERKQKENAESKLKKESMLSSLKNEIASVPLVAQSRTVDRVKEKENPNVKNELGLTERARKQVDIFPSLSSVRLNPRSDWEDDERETGHSLVTRGRDNGFSKGETYWERDYDFPRRGIFPQKSLHSDSGKIGSGEFNKIRDFSSRALDNIRPSARNEDIYRGSNNSRLGRDDSGRKDFVYSQGYKQSWKNKVGSLGGSEWSSRQRDGSYQDNSSSNSQIYSPNGKMFSLYGDKNFSIKNGKHFVDDPLKDTWADSTGNDMFPVVLHGLVKKKKDLQKEPEFYDPVRESFEAELERVQKMQEMERKRSIEEQERTVAMATREEDERKRIALEQEEYRKKVEVEAREAAWRAEKGRLEALQNAEEQRIAREEQKRRFHLEEERRKEGARQKLIELEERIARRQKEAANVSDGKSSVLFAQEQVNTIDSVNCEHAVRSSNDRNRNVEGDVNKDIFLPFHDKNTRWDASLGGFSNLSSRSLGKWNSLRDGHQPNGPFDLESVENSELEEDFSTSKSRYSIRQPRVLPPPTFNALHRLKRPGISRVEEIINPRDQENDKSDAKLDSGSTRCDSQSSFSVSSPPETPAHHSHDEFDTDFRGSISDKGNFVSDKNEMASSSVTEKCGGMDSVTAEAEEDWGSERNEELQEQEEYDEDESYDGEDEAHDGEDEAHDAENDHSKFVHDFECLNLEPDAQPDTDNLVLCFNEGVEVRMPIDDSENANAMNFVSLEFQNGNESLQSHVDVAPEASDSSRIKTRKENSCEESSNSLSVIHNQSTQNAAEMPINLQFGLFSSPPLIPSPVPAIQIGSIKMPLHLHPPIGPMTSHAPIFHFGELRYTSPISKGMLPLPSQPACQVSEVTNELPLRKEAGDSVKAPSSITANAEAKYKPQVATVTSKRRNFEISRGSLSSSNLRGRRYVFSSKHSTSLLPTPDASQLEPHTFSRRPRRQNSEYRVRENSEKILNTDRNDKSNIVKNTSRQFASRRNWKPNTPREPVGPSKNSEESVEASLEDRVVRVFEQPGIEAPSDDDDFIKVRSKRQLLNERRAQRERESKAKHRLSKIPKKLHPTPRSSIASQTSKNASSSSNIVSVQSVVVERSSPPRETSVKHSPLPPIGSNSKAISSRAQHSAKNIAPETNYESVETGLPSWDGSSVNQEVMSLTQTQLEEAMRHETLAGGDETLKPFSSASPVSSLLAGERIQFGAVTSPTILPGTTSAMHSVGLPFRRSVSGEICSIFFGKERTGNDTSEAEAEAAASAVAVAAITSDESATSAESTQKPHGPPEEPLSVTLPADLSVETPMWPSISNGSSSILPRMPAHFPFYDMNSLLGGRIFAYGQPEESSNQTAPQQATLSWPHHANIDPVYGQPAGFPSHFIGPPSNIPPVQGPPHMVVYNNFAPVGLSFMGTTAYVPSGKQPDWKHIPTSLMVGEGDIRVIAGQHNLPNMHPHVPPRPILHPIASPVTMFDASSLPPPMDRWPVMTQTHLQAPPGNPLPLNRRSSGPISGPGPVSQELNRKYGVATDDVAMQSSNAESGKETMKAMKTPVSGGMSHQKYAFASRNEWGNRRSGYNPMVLSKTKQIYVAKQSSPATPPGS